MEAEWRDRPCWLCWAGIRVIGQPVSLTTGKAESDPEPSAPDHLQEPRVLSRKTRICLGAREHTAGFLDGRLRRVKCCSDPRSTLPVSSVWAQRSQIHAGTLWQTFSGTAQTWRRAMEIGTLLMSILRPGVVQAAIGSQPAAQMTASSVRRRLARNPARANCGQKPRGRVVEQKSARQETLASSVISLFLQPWCVVLPAEGHIAVDEVDQPVV